MSTILITGCAGFIGSHFAYEMINSEHKIVGLDLLTYASRRDVFSDLSNYVPVFNGDICNKESVKNIIDDHKIDLIVNFAAETHVDNSIKDSSSFVSSNILGVKSILDTIKETKTRLVHISTDEVYGPALSGVTFDENSNLSPKNPYSATKAAADLMIEAYKNTYRVNAGIIRPCNNFGPRQNDEKFIPTILRSIREGRKIPIYGDGSQIREWMYVKDTARIIKSIIDKKLEFNIFNISTQREIKNIDVVRSICNKMKKSFDDVTEFVQDRPGHDIRYSISSSLLKSKIGLSFTDFDVALDETLKSFEEEKK